MAVRLCFGGRKDKGGSLKGEHVCGEKEKLGRIMDVQLEEEKEQVNGVKYTCFYSYQSIGYIATEQFCMPVKACDR